MCISKGDFKNAIEFLIIAQKKEAAFEVAAQYELVDHFIKCLGFSGTPDEYMWLARYFESIHDLARAGEYYARRSQPDKALKMYLKDGSDKCLEAATELVGFWKKDSLTSSLVDYLMGRSDGVPKDSKWFYKLSMALGNYAEV